MHKTIAITRPVEDADRLASTLTAEGNTVIVAPMLEIIPMTDSVQSIQAALQSDVIKAVCVTSKHAITALEGSDALHALKQLPWFAVGSATAQSLKRSGIEHVSVADEANALSLLALLQSELPVGTTILYLRGVHISRDIANILQMQGYNILEISVYDARPVEILPERLVEALRSGMLDEIWLYSARSAENYVRLIRQYGLNDLHGNVTCVALSEQVYKAAANLQWSGFRLLH